MGTPTTGRKTSWSDGVRTYLAAERTLLAWVRTGLALMGFGMVEIGTGAAALHADRVCGRIDAGAFHPRQVNNEAVVADSQSAAVVAAAADSRQEAAIAAEVHRSHYVGSIDAARDQPRALVDHTVVDLARAFVRREGIAMHAGPLRLQQHRHP